LQKNLTFIALVVLSLLVMGCRRTSNVCEANLPIEVRQGLEIDTADSSLGPFAVQIRNELVSVDSIVHGPLCVVDWSGTVYVDCDVEVAPWEETPNFFDECDVSIEEGAKVYVGYHNDELFYNGCSCHFSDSQ